ncbi:MAG: FlgD immunoglobulin-like domain containing protein, partial [Deltaproteobacteria bacterium]|nr:FlgD immunoglobulin-like domain containing protein [Deltaproteobacteria bacterium]
GGVSANRIAKWNGTTWETLGSGMNNEVWGLVASGSDVYAGGWFTMAGGKPSNYFGIYHDVPSGVAGGPDPAPKDHGLRLEQNRPNPFNQQTTIRYQLTSPGRVSLKVYNIAGQVVKTLVDKAQHPGVYNVNWAGKDETGKRVAGGLYFCRLNAADINEVKRLVLVK